MHLGIPAKCPMSCSVLLLCSVLPANLPSRPWRETFNGFDVLSNRFDPFFAPFFSCLLRQHSLVVLRRPLLVLQGR